MKIYRHYKGGLYVVLYETAFHTETKEPHVVYCQIGTGTIFVRPVSIFVSNVTDRHTGEVVKRFTEVTS